MYDVMLINNIGKCSESQDLIFSYGVTSSSIYILLGICDKVSTIRLGPVASGLYATERYHIRPIT
jgi:hypothetical protein